MSYTLNPTGFAALALSPGMLSEDAFIFLAPDSGTSGLLTAYLNYNEGTVRPLYSLRQTYSVLNGSSNPTSGIGYSGDLYINTSNQTMWGPKIDDSTWPGSGIPFVGETGSVGDVGPAGASGAVGQGVPSGGLTNQALVKTSAIDYDTEWKDVIDIFQYPKSNDLKHYEILGKNGQLFTTNGLEDLNVNGIAMDKSYGIICLNTGSKFIQFTRNYNYIRDINLTDLGIGEVTSLKYIKGSQDKRFATIYNNYGVSSPKIRFYVIPNYPVLEDGFSPNTEHTNVSISNSAEFDTGLPPSLYIKAFCHDRRTDTYYFCARTYTSGSPDYWNLYKYKDGVVSIALDLLTTRIHTGIYDSTSHEITDMEFVLENNTILFLITRPGGGSYIFQMSIDSGGIFSEIQENNSYGIDGVIAISPYLYTPSLNPSISYDFEDGVIYLSGLDNSLVSAIYSLSKKQSNKLYSDPSSKSISFDSYYGQKIIPQKYQQATNYYNNDYPYIDSAGGSPDGFGFGNGNLGSVQNGGGLSLGKTIRSEAFGRIQTFANSILSFSNEDGSAPSSVGYHAVAYLISIPSGIDCSWKSNIEVTAMGLLNTGSFSNYTKVISHHMEIFSNPKIDIFKIETGYFNDADSSYSNIAPAFAWGASGSGKITMYNHRMFSF